MESGRALHAELLEFVGGGNEAVGAALEALSADDRSTHVFNEWGPRDSVPKDLVIEVLEGAVGVLDQAIRKGSQR